MRLRTLWHPIILLALAGCGEGTGETNLEKGPFLQVDRASLGFGLEFGSGTLIDTTGFNSLYIENKGDEPLEITKVTKSGAGEFSMRLPTELAEGQPLKLESLKRTFVEVQFKPRDRRLYQGRLTIESNAANGGQINVDLFGCGLRNTEDTLPQECKDLIE
jgi:hypothetical protein